MQRTSKILAGGALAVALVAGGTGIAVAGGAFDDDGSETPITGDALERASEAALDHTGEGEVTDTEVGDEEGFYEVEVTLDNGDEVDVHLTEDFEVLGTERDAGETDDD